MIFKLIHHLSFHFMLWFILCWFINPQWNTLFLVSTTHSIIVCKSLISKGLFLKWGENNVSKMFSWDFHVSLSVFHRQFVSEWLSLQPWRCFHAAQWQAPAGFLTRVGLWRGDGSRAHQQTPRDSRQVGRELNCTGIAHMVVLSRCVGRPGCTCAWVLSDPIPLIFSMCKHMCRWLTACCVSLLNGYRPTARRLMLVLWVTRWKSGSRPCLTLNSVSLITVYFYSSLYICLTSLNDL